MSNTYSAYYLFFVSFILFTASVRRYLWVKKFISMSHKTEGTIVKITLKYSELDDLHYYPTIEYKVKDKIYLVESKESWRNPVINQKVEIYYKINDNSVILQNTFTSKYFAILFLLASSFICLLLAMGFA